MKELVPVNDYVLLTPSGRIKGFEDMETMKAFINQYYELKLKEYIKTEDYTDYDKLDEAIREDVFRRIGVKEGEFTAFLMMKVIEKIQNSDIFDDEKEEIIKKLMSKNIDLNVGEYQIDNIFVDIDTVSL